MLGRGYVLRVLAVLAVVGLLGGCSARATPSASPAGAARIFWANASRSTPVGTSLGVANIDGSDVNNNFITGANAPVGVVVVGDHLYWANLTDTLAGTTIGRANLDGSGVNESFITGADGPCGFAFTH